MPFAAVDADDVDVAALFDKMIHLFVDTVHACCLKIQRYGHVELKFVHCVATVFDDGTGKFIFQCFVMMSFSTSSPLFYKVLQSLQGIKQILYQGDIVFVLRKIFIFGIRCLKKMAVVAGIQKNVSYHTGRHTFGTLSLAAGGDLHTVGKLLGHTNIRSTQVCRCGNGNQNRSGKQYFLVFFRTN